MKKSGCVSAIGAKLNCIIKETEWKIDLGAPDKILEVAADIPPQNYINTVSEAGFKAEQIRFKTEKTDQSV